jgi:hypothetical protein
MIDTTSIESGDVTEARPHLAREMVAHAMRHAGFASYEAYRFALELGWTRGQAFSASYDPTPRHADYRNMRRSAEGWA